MKVLGGVLISLSLFAQQTNEPPTASTLPIVKTEVVVTGTRTEVELERSPVAAAVVTRDEMKMRNVQLLDSAIELVEGVHSLRTKGPQDTNTRVLMRGFNGQNRTLVLLDGQPLNDAYSGEASWTTLPIGELERVEVARGPFSSLYGGNAMGGVIQILTRPVEKRQVEVNAQYGSLDAVNYSARYSDRFRERLGVTLGYQRLQTGGYPARLATASPATAGAGTPVSGALVSATPAGARTFLVGDSGDNWYNQHAWRARGEYSFGSSGALSVQYIRQSYAYGHDQYRSFLKDGAGNPVDRGFVLIEDEGLARRLSLTPNTFLQGPGQGLSHFVNARWQQKLLTNGILSVAGGVYDQPDNSFRTPGTGATATAGPGSTSLRASRSYNLNAYTTWQSERHELTAGAETRNDRSNNSEYALPNYTLAEIRGAQTYFATGRTFNQAAYVQDQFRVSSRFQVVGGARLDYWRTTDGANDLFLGQGIQYLPERSQTALTAKIAGVYSAPAGWTFRASVGSAFRNPNVLELYRTFRLSTGTLFVANPALEPERLFSWEAGLRKSIGENFLVDASYFRNRITNLIYRKTDLDVDPTGRYRINVNAGEGTTDGVELSVRQRLRSWLQFRTTYTYTDAIISKNPVAPETIGKRVPNIPKHMTSFSLLGARGPWSGSLTGRYAGATFTTDTNTDVAKGVPGAYDPFFTADVTLARRIGRNVEVFANVENLLNRKYFLFYQDPGRLFYGGFRFRL
jgi:iron complex outermembrane receptor protein